MPFVSKKMNIKNAAVFVRLEWTRYTHISTP